jgi:hypothetical protein
MAIAEVASLCNYQNYAATSLAICERNDKCLEARYTLKNYLHVSLVRGTEDELLVEWIRIDDSMPNLGTAHHVTCQGPRRFWVVDQMASPDFQELITLCQLRFMELYLPKAGKVRAYKAKVEALKWSMALYSGIK